MTLVSFDGVTFRRRRGDSQSFSLTLDGLSFDAASVTAVVGCNGSGKTTLLELAARKLKPHTGRVRWRDGLSVAYLPQSSDTPEHLPVTVRDVVAMGRYRRLGALRRTRSTDRAVVDAAVDRFDVGGLLRRQFWSLSGGQRQRVMLAQCVAQQPDVVLLDEPITGLDVPAQQVVLSYLADARADGVCVVVSTHQMTEAHHADRVLVLNDGQVVDDGSPTDVLTPERLHVSFGLGAPNDVDALFAMLSRDQCRVFPPSTGEHACVPSVVSSSAVPSR